MPALRNLTAIVSSQMIFAMMKDSFRVSSLGLDGLLGMIMNSEVEI